ncbi:hypothetical protein BGZ72_006659 [Mortierella alpina]|nr:hypothetical protein BGZ72_006659 [Mortierella alpina]
MGLPLDFKFPTQDFLNLPTSPPPVAADSSMQLFNPSEQRYFSEFLDTLVVDQDFTFDPSSIPNLPNLPLFTPETMPGGFNLDSSNPYLSSSLATPGLISSNSNSSSMEFDMTSPSSQSSFGGPHSLPNHYGRGGFPSPQQQGASPTSPGSPPSTHPYTISTAVSIPNKRKTNKASKGASTNDKISTPIQQLSKLSLNNSNHSNIHSNGNSNTNGNSNGPSNPKKNKRDEDEHPTSSSSPTSASSPSRRPKEIKEEGRERNTSVISDGSVSDAAHSAGAATTTKRKPYKELLTEEEKRANHIASEQKRRNTIRNGFKDMTEIIPDLKDVNSSKSTILFKAVDFIKHLERRNRILQEKANRLESRLMDQRNDGGMGESMGGGGLALGLDDKRLQDIPHIYPVSCSR